MTKFYNGMLTFAKIVLRGPGAMKNKISLLMLRPIYRLCLEEIGGAVRMYGPPYISYPENVRILSGAIISRQVQLTSEFPDSHCIIRENAQVNNGVHLDYSGGLDIGPDSLISEGVIVYTHDHQLDPRSHPIKCPKKIEENVWIGARAMVLHSCHQIGKGAIIAAGAVVTKNVENYTIVAGNPAVVIRKLESQNR